MAFPRTLAHHPATYRVRIVVASFFLVAIFASPVTVRSAPTDEYQVKAAFLFNFAKFVVWPANAFPNANTPLVIGVLGHDPFGAYLDDIVRGERVDNRQLLVQRYRSPAEVTDCHVLFISRSESSRIDRIVSTLKDRKLLIVTDADGGQGGVIIRFVMVGNRIRFKIDVEAAKAANLSISSKLLRLG